MDSVSGLDRLSLGEDKALLSNREWETALRGSRGVK